MEEKLTLNDGTELAGHAIEAGGRLYVYLDDSTLAEAFTALIDPDRTRRITADRYGEETNYIGYTHLKAVSEESGTAVNAVLAKEVSANV